MNRYENDILKILMNKPYINQRMLSEDSGYSLGIVNRSIKTLKVSGYLDERMKLTSKAKEEFKDKAPRNAIILAAGLGMRMVPINTETPKGLLEVKGEPVIERIIKQLHEVNVRDIYMVVGFMKEKYEYLIDEYEVRLIVNPEYAIKNNLYSLKFAVNYLSNTYIIPCDIWCSKNPFSQSELYSWYMVNDVMNYECPVRVNRKMELVKAGANQQGNSMIGICYLQGKEANIVKQKVLEMCNNVQYEGAFWEETLYEGNRMIVQANLVGCKDVVEINTYEQLRDLDSNSNQLKSDAIQIITSNLNVKENEIIDITILKKGMTNRSFLFACKGKKYIMRIPGEGTDKLINRKEEAELYEVLKGKDICDDVAYINPDNGYKITEFIENARVCNPENKEDVKKCMMKLRHFHEKRLKVNHEFDIFRQIEVYENLWNGAESVYKDYKKTKEKIISLKTYIDMQEKETILTHIDAIPDNFLFSIDSEGKENIKLIDWEYAGMQDPHLDIAMFGIYSLYDKEQIDYLIDVYFQGDCPNSVRIKIYCYVAVAGLLWSNWCEYKNCLGVEFGEYSLRQYRYAKDYYNIVQAELKKKVKEQNE